MIRGSCTRMCVLKLCGGQERGSSIAMKDSLKLKTGCFDFCGEPLNICEIGRYTRT